MKKTQRLFVLVLALCMLVQMLPVAAFEFEVPEAAEEIVEKADNAALSDEETIATYDDTYGQLLFYSGFNTENSLANEIEEESPVKGLKAIGGGSATVDGRTATIAKGGAFGNGSYVGTGVTSSNGEVWKYSDGTVVTGQFYFFADYYFDVDEVTKDYLFLRFAPSLATGDDLYGLTIKTAKQWLTTKSLLDYKTIDANQFKNINRTNGVTKIEIGHSDAGNVDTLYFDNLKVYVQPDNALWLTSDTEGSNRTLTPASGETYIFPNSFNNTNVKIWTDGTNMYEAGVSYTAADLAGKTYFPRAYEEMPEAYDTTYGQLLFYTGFNNETSKVLTNEFEANSPVKNLVITGSANVVGNNVVSSVSKDSASFAKAIVKKDDSSVWTYPDGTNVEGKLTWFADYAFENDQTTGYGFAMLNESTSFWSKMNKNNAGIWTTSAVSQSDVGGTNTQVKSVDLRYVISDSNRIYYDNFKVYIQPTNALWLASDSTGADRTFAVISGDTYTFPTVFNGETVTAWTDGATLWTAGSEIAKSTIAAKTIYPVKIAAIPAEYDETYGQLVWFDNFSDDIGFTNIADISFVKNASDTIKVKAGYYAVQPISGNAGVKFYEFERNGDSWKYTNGKTMSGQVSILASICNESDNLPNYGVQTAATPATWTANIEGRTIGTSFTPTWNHYIRYGLAVGDNSTLAPKSGYQTIHTLPTFLDEYITKDSKQTVELSRFGLSIADTASREYYARSLAVYVKPDNALWLIDSNGDNRAYEIASDETYTFPTNFNGADVLTWKNGTTTYAAGETVSIADIAGKTWQVGETVGLAFDDSVSVRVSGTPGIRFKTNLNLAAYTNADEIGFLATRDKHFNEQFGGLDENLVLTNEKVNNTKYCAHASVSAANIVDTGDGETASFNAVVINVPERKATLTETLHLRSYVTCGGVTYYSAVRKESIYEAAKKISESSGYQDNDYIKNILSICEDTSGN